MNRKNILYDGAVIRRRPLAYENVETPALASENERIWRILRFDSTRQQRVKVKKEATNSSRIAPNTGSLNSTRFHWELFFMFQSNVLREGPLFDHVFLSLERYKLNFDFKKWNNKFCIFSICF